MSQIAMNQIQQPSPASVTIAAFDFDGTLTTQDSLWPFLRFCCSPWQLVCAAFRASPWLLKWKLGGLFGLGGTHSNSVAKAHLLAYAFAHLSPTALAERGAQFSLTLDRLLRPEMRGVLDWHRQQGHHLVLVSASLNVYLQPWAARQGFVTCLCTTLATVIKMGGAHPTEKIAPHFVDGNCYGPVKAERLQAYLQQILGPNTPYQLYAYGDTRGDKEMLALAHFPFYKGKACGQAITQSVVEKR